MGNGESQYQGPDTYLFDVLKFCSWEERASAQSLCRSWNDSPMLKSHVFWQFLCDRLVEEYKLHYIRPRGATVQQWKELFHRLYSMRNLWDVGVEDEEEQARLPRHKTFRFSISVSARFRPAVTTAGKGGGRTQAVILPLHQRLALIKSANNNCSTAEAMRILWSDRASESGEEVTKDAWSAADVQYKTHDPEEEAATAAVEEEDKEGDGEEGEEGGRGREMARYKASVLAVQPKEGSVLMVAPGIGLREFGFEVVLDATASQRQVYASAAQPLVSDVLNGFNASLIVYGQTGSGKTFTMFGDGTRAADAARTSAAVLPKPPVAAAAVGGEGKGESKSGCYSADGAAATGAEVGVGEDIGCERGVVQRICAELLSAVAARRALGVDATLSMSYVEVFGDEVSDLLRGGIAAGQSRVAAQQYVLSGAAEMEVASLAALEELLAVADSQKRKAATAMNDRSSRAHSLVILGLAQTDVSTGVTLTSKLFLADLGGSEQVKKSRVEGERLQEAININQGLFALKRCIDALNTRAPHVPYKDSRLTQLLSSALGGNSKTCVIVTAGPEQQHALDTLETMRFGERCSAVENRATHSAAALAAALAQLEGEIRALEDAVRAKERWEDVREVRRDERAEAGTADVSEEVVVTTRLVGAEAERAQLTQLLRRRRELLGMDPSADDDTAEFSFGASKQQQ